MFSEAIGMGGYGGYVWSCYGLTLVALTALAVIARRRWQTELRQARRRAQVAQGSSEPST